MEKDGQVGSIPTVRLTSRRISIARAQGSPWEGKDERLIGEWINDISIKKFQKDRNAYLIRERHKSTASQIQVACM